MATKKQIEEFLESKNLAIAGVSRDKKKFGYRVFEDLTSKGYNAYPINPNTDVIDGKKCYNSLSDIPDQIEIVNIFRRSEDVLPIVQDAIKIGVKAVWMQYGIINKEAAQLALDAGLDVVMDTCMKIEHAYLGQ